MSKSLFVMILLFGCTLHSAADSIPGKRFYPSVTMGFNFNFSDFFTGVGAGVEDTEYQWGARLNLDFRPYFRKVQIQDNPGLVNQFYERKYFLSLDLEKRFFEFFIGKASVRPFVTARTGILLGNYRGLRRAPDPDFVISPVAGLSFGNKFAFWKFGYSWLNIQDLDTPAGRVIIQVTFLLD